MRVTVTKTGGFAGLHQQLGPADMASLDPGVAGQVGRIVTELDFFNLPESLPGARVYDGYSYAVRLVDDERDHTVRTEGNSDDPAVAALHELIGLLNQVVGFEYRPRG